MGLLRRFVACLAAVWEILSPELLDVDAEIYQ